MAAGSIFVVASEQVALAPSAVQARAARRPANGSQPMAAPDALAILARPERRLAALKSSQTVHLSARQKSCPGSAIPPPAAHLSAPVAGRRFACSTVYPCPKRSLKVSSQKRQHSPRKGLTRQPASKGPMATVLLVEPHAESARAYAQSLERAGFRVETSTAGGEDLNLAPTLW